MEYPPCLNGTEEETYLLASQPEVALPYIVIVALMGFVGTLGNLLIMATVGFSQNEKHVENMFIFNLACSDIVVTALVDPFAVIGVAKGKRFYDDKPGLNAALGSVCMISCASSLLSIGFIAINRYVYICNYGRYRSIFTRNTTAACCVTTWLFGVVIDAPAHVRWTSDGHPPLHTRDTGEHVYAYTVFYLTVGVVVPFIVITICYVRIFIYINAAKQKVRRFTRQSAHKTLMKAIRQARMMLVIFLTFTVCWTPYLVVLYTNANQKLPHLLLLYAALFAHLHATGNFVVYGVCNKRFRDDSAALLGRLRLPCVRLKACLSQRSSFKERPKNHTEEPVALSALMSCPYPEPVVAYDEHCNGDFVNAGLKLADPSCRLAENKASTSKNRGRSLSRGESFSLELRLSLE